MSNQPTLRCFVSMKYGVPWIDPVYDIIERAASTVGLSVYRSDKSGGLAQNILQKVYSEIDDSFILICEGSIHSWFVAFELAHAMKHKQYILLVQSPEKDFISNAGGINVCLHAQTDHIKYSLSCWEGRRKLEDDLAQELSKE